MLPPVFTPDAEVLTTVPVAWWFFAALQPVAGVFAIDGVLLGATAFLHLHPGRRGGGFLP